MSIAEQRVVSFIPAWSLAFLQSTGNHYSTIYQIANILETAMINALVLGSSEALFIPLRMSLEQPQGNQYQWRYEGLNVCTWTSLITYR